MKNFKKCFFITPFLPELNYFFLFIKNHLKEKHGIECQRADESILTIPLLEKIKNQINTSDLIIADISGKNPNVYYELGLAHARNKKVILITNDEIKDTPSDIKHFEFIKYDLNQHVSFLGKLDNAIHHVFVEQYRDLFKNAKSLLAELNKDLRTKYEEQSEEQFQSMIMRYERVQDLPDIKDKRAMAEFLLPKIIKNIVDIEVSRNLNEWLSEKFKE